jgi:hypothetical protein
MKRTSSSFKNSQNKLVTLRGDLGELSAEVKSLSMTTAENRLYFSHLAHNLPS